MFFSFNLEHRRFGCLCLEDLETLGSHFPWITLEPMAHVRWIFESSLPTMSRERWFSWHQVKVLLKFWWAFGLWMLRGLWAWAGMRLASTMNFWKGWSLKFAIIQSISIIISTLYKHGRSWNNQWKPLCLVTLSLVWTDFFSAGYAYASCVNMGQPQLGQKMVTHSWRNKFSFLPVTTQCSFVDKDDKHLGSNHGCWGCLNRNSPNFHIVALLQATIRKTCFPCNNNQNGWSRLRNSLHQAALYQVRIDTWLWSQGFSWNMVNELWCIWIWWLVAWCDRYNLCGGMFQFYDDMRNRLAN